MPESDAQSAKKSRPFTTGILIFLLVSGLAFFLESIIGIIGGYSQLATAPISDLFFGSNDPFVGSFVLFRNVPHADESIQIG